MGTSYEAQIDSEEGKNMQFNFKLSTIVITNDRKVVNFEGGQKGE